MADEKLKVAIIGASGIGKNHARWFHGQGCDVCAFVGSSPESLGRTRSLLQDEFGFSGRGYTSVDEMLSAEAPDAACISSPMELHYEHARVALGAGCHVLCEKPLVYRSDLSAEELVHQARWVCDAARDAGLILAMQLQYAVLTPALLEMSDCGEGRPVRSFGMEMESRSLKHAREYEDVWHDLAPHPLSVLLGLPGQPRVDLNTVTCHIGQLQTDARFIARGQDGLPIDVSIVVRRSLDAGPPVRRFTFNGTSIACSGRRNSAGHYRTYLSTRDGQDLEISDPVDSLIGRFARACQGEGRPAVEGPEGVLNLQYQLQILARGERS